MHRYFSILFLTFIFGNNIQPKIEYLATASIVSSFYHNNTIIVGTDVGTIESFDLESNSHSIEYLFSKIHDFMGDQVYPWVMSIDKLNDIFLVVTQGENGSRTTSVLQNGVLTNIQFISSMLINKAVFVDDRNVLVALLSNELILFNLKHESALFKIQVNQSVFSDFILNEDKSKVAVCDESGAVTIIDIKTSEIINRFKNGNLDRVFTLDWKNHSIVTAGQDRRAVLYNLKTDTQQVFRGEFPIYASGLSQHAELGAYSSNEMNDIIVFDTESGEKRFNLQGMDSALISIYFTNNRHVIGVGSNQTILIWELT